MKWSKVDYNELNAPQKEIYNFQKVAARLGDYGFNCIWLSDDWQGADFLACHLDGRTVLRVQLKARLVLDKKYSGKDIRIAFREGDKFYLYPHDEFFDFVVASDRIGEGSVNWNEKGYRFWSKPPTWARAYLEDHLI